MTVIVILFFVAQMVSDIASANIVGDENQLPENEVMLDLSGGTTQSTGSNNNNCYHKNNTFVWGIYGGIYNGDMFDGTHQMGMMDGSNKMCIFMFPIPLKITRIRVHPMGANKEMNANKIEICKPLFSWKFNNQWILEEYSLFSSNTNNIQQETDYIEALFSNLITDCIAIGNPDQNNLKINEIEIYYDKTFNPYPSESMVSNYYNSTNITNEYFNETNNHYLNNTYQNDTFYNKTYVNNTYIDETYWNETYLSEIYTGNYTDITYRNITYANFTNQTGGNSYQNTTLMSNNYTYLNDSMIRDTERLKEELEWIKKKLNDSKTSESKEIKSYAKDTYIIPIFAILLILIIILQIIIIFRRKRKEIPIDKEDTVEAEIEHVPQRGFTREETQILRSEDSPPGSIPEVAPMLSLPYPQYQHADPQPEPLPSSLNEDFNVREMRYQPTQPQENVTDNQPLDQTTEVPQPFLPEHVNTVQEQSPTHATPTIIGQVEDRLGDQKALPRAKLIP